MGNNRKNFRSLDALKHVERVLNEAGEAIRDTNRTIVRSSMPEILGAAMGAGVGGALSFGALYALGVTGLGAAGITSALALAGGVVGGGMAAGVLVMAAPAALFAVGGYAAVSASKSKRLRQEKERLYQEALRKHDAVQRQLAQEVNASKERIEYLNSLVIMLDAAIRDLRADLAGD